MTKKPKQARSGHGAEGPLVGLFGEPSSSKKGAVEWFVFIDEDCKRVGKGPDAFDLATKAVQSLAAETIPTGKNERDLRIREWMLELAVEATRAREYRQRLSPRQRAKMEATFTKMDAAFDAMAANAARRERSRCT